jgi:magnesium and cobalt transporter
MDASSSRPGLIERLTALLLREPEDREQLLDLLRGAFERHLMDADALSIIEGALSVADMAVRDVMVPRAQMDVVDINDGPERIVEVVLAAAHSRFPAVGEGKDDVLGILLAKDLLRGISPAKSSICATCCGRRYSSPNRSA